MKKSMLSILFLLFLCNLQGIVVLVHGTFAKNDPWHKKGGDFHKAYTDVNITDTIESFLWSGKLSSDAHIEAARQLCEYIIKRPEDEEKTFIGHSHGGSVINIASHLLDTAQYAVQHYQGDISEKIHNMTRLFVSEPYYLHEDFPYSYSREFDDDSKNQEAVRKAQENIQIIEENLYKKLEESVDYLSRMLLEVDSDGLRFVRKQFVMHRVELLATPILVGNYSPNMNAIKRVASYYSQADWIQMVGGQMKHEYPAHPRISQIELVFAANSMSNLLISPGHGELHNPLMAQWLAAQQVVDKHILDGKHYKLILHQDGTGFTCQEKKSEKK
ncbi:hypothetical protein JKY79_01785 [Candidatus Babeliales bacterium]|nr:hypothetical protein [Candidatus Babeliales bacterium]